MDETNIIINIGVWPAIIATCSLLVALGGIVWKLKGEIRDTIDEGFKPIKGNMKFFSKAASTEV